MLTISRTDYTCNFILILDHIDRLRHGVKLSLNIMFLCTSVGNETAMVYPAESSRYVLLIYMYEEGYIHTSIAASHSMRLVTYY